ncbi:MAG TPA: hypothetical protein VHW00_05990 [Thermoanaerobaculia bacterium]|nr:hypothetical protein [Thermoanaerobaculia bacterium]
MITIAAVVLLAQAVLFPQPVHLTRQITDPFSPTPIVVEQYCYGNRLVTVRGARTTIADYERNELTEIDRDAGTYSITSFEDVARATAGPYTAATKASAKQKQWTVNPKTARASKLGRNAEVFELSQETAMQSETIEVSIDRTIELSPAAADVLLGVAYPSQKNGSTDAVLNVARARRGLDVASSSTTGATANANDPIGLPIEQITRIEVEGERLEHRDVVVHVGRELPDPTLIALPPNATRVESQLTLRARVLEEIDRPLPPAAAKP